MTDAKYVIIHNIEGKMNNPIIHRQIASEEYVNGRITKSNDEVLIAVFSKKEYLEYLKSAIKII